MDMKMKKLYMALRAEADAFPRCGEGWPMNAAEEAAQAWADENEIMPGGMTRQEAEAFERAMQESMAAEKAAKAAKQEQEAEELEAAFAVWQADKDAYAFVRSLQPLHNDRLADERFDFVRRTLVARRKDGESRGFKGSEKIQMNRKKEWVVV